MTVQCDVPRVSMVSLTLVLPGAVDCSLAVTSLFGDITPFFPCVSRFT